MCPHCTTAISDAPDIVLLGDLSPHSPDKYFQGFQQVVESEKKNTTRKECYENISNAYKSRNKPPTSSSAHNAVHPVPTYKTNLKSKKPQNKEI